MQHASASIHIDKSREQAWQILRNFGVAHNYVPGIIKTEITTEQKEGVGASREVFQTQKRSLSETVIQWNEGSGFTIRLHRGEKGPIPPMKTATYTYTLEDDGDGCRIINSMSFDLGDGLLAGMLNGVIARVVQKNLDDVTLGMKHYYETGEAVTPEIRKQLKKKYTVSQ